MSTDDQSSDPRNDAASSESAMSETARVKAAMQLALCEARAASEHGDVPVGAVVLRHDEVIAARHNERELTQDPTAHAEVLALRDAAEHIGNWHLDECTLIVTLEPCCMCAGAMVNARLGRLVFGAADPKAGAAGSVFNITASPLLNHRVLVEHETTADECGTLLREFFAARRKPTPGETAPRNP